jgi:hypothetical protein
VNSRLADKPVDNYLIRLATGARASVSFIHAGGLKPPSITTRFSPMRSLLGFEPGLIRDLEWVADQTGGLAAFFVRAEEPLVVLDRETRSRYVLGYYPAREVAADQYRTIEVSVGRAGARALYRHGYQAKPQPANTQEYRYAITKARMNAASELLFPSPALSSAKGGVNSTRMWLKLAPGVAESGAGGLRLSVSVDPSWIYFRNEAAGFAADLDLRIFAEDISRNVVGEINRTLPLKLTSDEYGRARRTVRPQALTFEFDLAVSARPEFLRAVLYQFDTDRTAAAQLRLSR